MDPTTTWALICDTDESMEDRLAALRDLAEWLGRGGFAPLGIDTDGVTADDFADVDGVDYRPLLQAVRVALASGDLSGLAGCGIRVIR